MTSNPFAEVIESFYVETQQGLFFAVKGLEHPPDRIISVLRYAPDTDGSRIRDGVHYRRFYHFAEQNEFLRSYHPQFLDYDPVFHTILQSVPNLLVRRIFDPRSRLQEMTREAVLTGVQKDAVTFANLLQQESGVPGSAIGISGSLLIGLHTDSSDLDLSVFGVQNCRRVYDALRRLLDFQSVEALRRFDKAGIEKLYAERVTDTHMPFGEFAASEKNKVCQGSFNGRPYFIRFIKEAHECGELYGSVEYTPLGRAVITATIANDEDAIFTPCRYVLSGVQVLEGPQLTVDEVVSFRGRFCEQAGAGASIRAAGTLERVKRLNGETRCRLLSGNSPEDTMVQDR